MPFGLTEFCHWLPSGYAGSGLQEEEFPLGIGARHPLGLRHNVRATDARGIFTPSLPIYYMLAQVYSSWISVTASVPLEQDSGSSWTYRPRSTHSHTHRRRDKTNNPAVD